MMGYGYHLLHLLSLQLLISNEFNLMSSQTTYINDGGCANTDGGGWNLVRRVSSTIYWHPPNDNCEGTESKYGSPSYINATTIDAQGNSTWSFEYSNRTFNQFLFATGDCSVWLVTTPDQVYGTYYSYQDRCILTSSQRSGSYYAKWYNRASLGEDPWVSINDHVDNTDTGNMLYGENSYVGHGSLLAYGGGNVWIRYVTNDTRECRPTVNPTNFPTFSPTNITISPTLVPTNIPSNFPTLSPSNSPHTSPTIYPSSIPSVSPSIAPTMAPTDSPINSPTHVPTKSPTTPTNGMIVNVVNLELVSNEYTYNSSGSNTINYFNPGFRNVFRATTIINSTNINTTKSFQELYNSESIRLGFEWNVYVVNDSSSVLISDTHNFILNTDNKNYNELKFDDAINTLFVTSYFVLYSKTKTSTSSYSICNAYDTLVFEANTFYQFSFESSVNWNNDTTVKTQSITVKLRKHFFEFLCFEWHVFFNFVCNCPDRHCVDLCSSPVCFVLCNFCVFCDFGQS